MTHVSKIILNCSAMNKVKQNKIIFFGNGPLADFTKQCIENSGTCEIVFHAKNKADLDEVKRLKSATPSLFGILASFGVIIKSDILELFEPIGILNIHPSLLPKYRGASPIESAILNGDQDFSVSVMKLVKAMDAGPIYYQTTIKSDEFSSAYPAKSEIYQALSFRATTWLVEHLNSLPTPIPQNDKEATYTSKFDTSMSQLDLKKPAMNLLNQIRAFQNFPKSKIKIGDHECIILEAHLDTKTETNNRAKIKFTCGDNQNIIIDRLQPLGRKPMDANSFYNGYMK